MVEGLDGNFYGTTKNGGQTNLGTIFQITPTGRFATIASFNAATGGHAGRLVQAKDGFLYGHTSGGGTAGRGTFFRFVPPPVVEARLASAQSIELRWSSLPGRVFRAEHATELAAPNWIALAADITATAKRSSLKVDISGVTEGFYRIIQLQP